MLSWKIGLEIELLAPRGLSRESLATAIAHCHHGRVVRFFHPQAEFSKVPGKPVFESLTLGFEVRDADGGWRVRCVDDLTLQDDLDQRRPAWPGWYRIVSDEIRLLRLVEAQADPAAPLATVLDPIARLYDTTTATNEGGMVRVADRQGASIAIAAPLPGERERPCEVILAPAAVDHAAVWDQTLALARGMGFTVPGEGATHLHFDATPLCSAQVLAAVVRLFHHLGPCLRQLLATNPRCRRLGPWPTALLEAVTAADFATLDWPTARERLKALPLTKYCDVNLMNLLRADPDKHTLEVRILPVSLDTETIVATAGLIEGLLRWALRAEVGEALPEATLAGLLALADLDDECRAFWTGRGAERLGSVA